MVLAIDVGNTNIKIGGYMDNKLLFVSRIGTDTNKTSDEYATIIKSIISLYNYEEQNIKGAIISSVVPSVQSALKKAVERLKKVKVLTIGPGVKTGINIKIDNPAQLGADLVCCGVAAVEKYKTPIIIYSLGTATAITAIDKDSNLIGGSIMPGVKISLEALTSRTAQLPQISLESPVTLIGTNTNDSMTSGVLLGTASMIDGMSDRYREVLGDDLIVIATGGLAADIVPHCKTKVLIDENLLLEGLMYIYKKNVK